MNSRTLVALCVFGAALSACAADEMESEQAVELGSTTEAFQKISLPGGDTHSSITKNALSALVNSNFLDTVRDADTATDDPPTKDDSRYHVDNCRVSEGFDSIRDRYDQAVDLIAADLPTGLGPKNAGWKLFGSILHTSQDFYAHSNWVDSAQAGQVTDGYDFEFPSLQPGDPVGSPDVPMVVLEAGIPKSWRVSLGAARLPAVTTDSGNAIGLITGVYDNGDGTSCVPNGAIAHGSVIPGVVAPLPATLYLSKDDSVAINHYRAVDRAKTQTIVEFCRLARLIYLKEGVDAHDAFVAATVRDAGVYDANCGDPAALVTALDTTVL